MEYICNRLMVVGSAGKVKKFARSNWDKVLGAKHCELAECSPGRYISDFNTKEAPIVEPLRKLSLHWPKLIFLLDWEWEDKSLKGFLKAQAGLLESYWMEY